MNLQALPSAEAQAALIKHLQQAFELEAQMPQNQRPVVHSLLKQLRETPFKKPQLWLRLKHLRQDARASRLLQLYTESSRYAWWAQKHEIIPELLTLAEIAWDAGPQKSERTQLRLDFARFTQHERKQKFRAELAQLNDTKPVL